ncbi:ATP-dependent RNA helicase DHX29 [Syngnathus scovelli]|uniref:ATP-dependent RNA helicase DHX29 n=1 Tax=Syngnathus scovelli TaxID=161590 RepID=UPI002110330A|nr:ATP-dependent RNA helicase DHX29 [Syngnathus scovelli]XP_049593846.1 ATP-dependent RNA helicase DHX29 [Syngnathus scovelli]XP_049593847.1 ATP-dependent RNA helicase DHX29 [Syngnathus scovelli]
MGGKKKKSTPPVVAVTAGTPAASGRASVPTVGNGATDEPKKQPGSSKLSKAAKENKPKGPKTYSLTNTAQVDTGGVTDKSILKVSIQADLEKKIIKLINDFRQENGDKGPVSGRLTNKKLLDLYTALQKFNFKREHIEEAMKSSVLYGGDLHSALDWLCLNLRDEELPEGFSQQMQEESQRSRPRFQPPVRPRTPSPELPKTPPSKDTSKASIKDDDARMKDWILRYAEQSSDDEEEEGEGEKISQRNPELDQKFDPNDRYLILTAQLYDAKEMAMAAKTKGDKAAQRMAQDRIRIIQQEMKPLESHPVFNPAIKVVDAPQKEKMTPSGNQDKDEIGFQLFEKAEKEAPADKVTQQKKKNEPKDIRNFDYTARSWTGKSPKQFLIDWVRKNLPKSPPPAFHKVAAGRYWRCKVRVQRMEDVLEVCPTILTEDSMQAQHLGATLALYNLVKGQSVHQLLPPTYRNVWLEWRDGEQQQKEETRSAANKPRDQFIARLLTRLKQQQHHHGLESQSDSPTWLSADADEEAEDSWESLATLDIVEKGGGDVEGKNEGRGSEQDEALRTARGLLMNLRTSPLALRLLADREQLPVFQQRQRVLEALQRHRVVVVAGETGSGKSTQIPQFLLDELLLSGEAARPCNIVVTQPRRISAMSLACRVSQELGCQDGPGSKSSLCGYQIRMENQSGEWTRLLYCTTGVLLRKLQHDRHLSNLTHIIVDEVHERSVQSDFLLTILKDVVSRRADLQLILMSATADCHKFSNYFNRCPVLNIPGRTFPVEVFHLEDIVEETGYVLERDSEYCQKVLEEEEEVSVAITQKGGKTLQHQEVIVRDSSSCWDLGPDLDHFSSRTRQVLQYMNPNKINMDLLVELISYLDKAPQFTALDGAVLVFLPGLAHIQQLFDLLSSDKRFKDKNRYRIVALHSTLSSKEQAAAFTVPPAGVRKIVLSTNIAETGVTIPDVVFVIDTGKTKENKYHESSQMSSLVETFVSKASALQRQGRAGRVRNGFCFRLYPKYRFDSFMEYSIPEILRVPLEELCLHIMKCEYGSPEEFLSGALDAPQPQSVMNAVNLLRKIGACQPGRHLLTPLGQHLANLPVNVKIGKMLIYSAILGCLEPIATIAAAITEKSPFSTPMNRKEEANLAKAALALANSDHMTIYNAYLGWKNSQNEGYKAEMSFCRKHFLNRAALATIEDVKQELMKMMEQAGFCSSRPPRPSAASKPPASLLAAALTAGLYDSVARLLCVTSVDVLERVACSAETPQGRAQVHPSSVNRNLQTHGWLLYQEKVKYTKIYLRDTTLVSPFPMLLFGGDIDIQHRERLITLDGWMHFQAPVRIGVIFKHLRKLLDSLLEKKLENPRMNLEGEKTIQIILELINSENTS